MRQVMITIMMLFTFLCLSSEARVYERIEIDTQNNFLYLYHGYSCIGQYSIASGMKEEMIINGKKYKFNTPTGNFKVWKKEKEPKWTPPDWFYEDGNIPPVPDRVSQNGILGSRALYLSSEGIMIHGTNDESSIGKFVTHGCIRMFDSDLNQVYEKCKVGTRVYIY